MKILAVGMNYLAHTKELEHTDNMPEEPVLFMKPDSALLKDGKPFFIPDFSNEIHYETELVVRICRLGKNIAERFAYRYYDSVTVGIDFTARDLQRKLRNEGKPWLLSKGFDNSATIGDFVPIGNFNGIENLHFRLEIDGKIVQSGYSGEMYYSVDQIIAFASRYFTLKIGDLIYTGTPAGVGPVEIGQHLQGFLEKEKVLDFHIR